MSKVRPSSNADNVLAQLPPLSRYALALTRDETAAEDLVHDALVRAYERRGTFRSGGNLRTWLLSILHNVFIDGRRQRAAEQRREEEFTQLAEVAVPSHQESAVRLQQIRRAFLCLPKEQRAVLHLVVVESLPYQEAADALGIPVGTLMSRLGRARGALRAFDEGRGCVTLAAAPPAPKPTRPRPNLRAVGGNDD